MIVRGHVLAKLIDIQTGATLQEKGGFVKSLREAQTLITAIAVDEQWKGKIELWQTKMLAFRLAGEDKDRFGSLGYRLWPWRVYKHIEFDPNYKGPEQPKYLGG